MIVFNFRNLFSLICLVCFSLLAFSCGEDDVQITNESTNINLNGNWFASSYQDSGVELLANEFISLQLIFTSTNIDGGTFSANTIDNTGMLSIPTFVSYTVIDDGNRIVIGADTLDMSASSTDLTLNGNIFFNTGEISITAEKQ